MEKCTIIKRLNNGLGYMIRLDKTIPFRRGLKESLDEVNSKIGRPSLMWMKVIEKDLHLIDINFVLNRSPTDIIVMFETKSSQEKEI